ncbi:allantoicase [uncultured Corynebacterium sp.]|uniref:allantoicase n=1 Tax=uncultured Corynebacterium sp. TaxID=159447 RepID=UPI0025D97272|nr:allantoicase [uncultured Corynebacterium sp.]
MTDASSSTSSTATTAAATSTAASTAPDWTRLTDLACRDIGGAVVWATDESFAEKENLISAAPPRFDPEEFGHKGKVYDGWETRRRRTPGVDHAIVRLGVPGTIDGVVVDTAFFLGNYPPQVSVAAARIDEATPADELMDAEWVELIGPTDIGGGAAHFMEVCGSGDAASGRVFTHVRLTMHPDGGVARFRVHGVAAPDPAFLGGLIDVAAVDNGGRVTDCSDAFYGSPTKLIARGLPVNMGGGWENARRRGEGNDFVEVALAGPAAVEWVELDTSWFVHNAPGAARLSGRTLAGKWVELVETTPLLPDHRRRFTTRTPAPAVGTGDPEASGPPIVDAVRLDVYPDGGMARLRVMGTLTPDALAAARDRFGR